MTLSKTMSLARTSSEQTADSPLICPIVAFDGGNRTIQWVNPIGQVRQIPSYLKPIDPSWEDVEPDANSLVIEFEGRRSPSGKSLKT